MTFRIVCSTFFTALLAMAAAHAGENVRSAGAQRFDELKKLAGDWYEAGKDGKPTDKLVSSIRVTSAGPYSEAKEVVGGYFILRADSYNEAVELMHDSPFLDDCRVELRQTDPMGCGGE